jgi:hypothetical protein
MTWLVYGVSCLLVLAGAVAITSGAPIIQLERGWAEVIAGSVAMSSGGVVFAIGVVAMRLESLRDMMAIFAALAPAKMQEQAARPLPVADEPVPTFVPPPPQSVAPTLSEVEPVPADAMVPLATPSPAAEPDPGLWKRVRRPAIKVDAPSLEADGFPDRLPPEPTPFEHPVADASPVEAPPSLPVEPAVPPVAPVSVRPEPDTASTVDTGQLGWLERSLFKSRAQKERDEPREVPASPGRTEPAMDLPLREPAFTSFPSRDTVEPAPAAEPTSEAAPMAPPTVPADESPTVIGRYQAGVASYIMYSDGTIEVETEGGESHRFGSMDELKAYIASKDQAGA